MPRVPGRKDVKRLTGDQILRRVKRELQRWIAICEGDASQTDRTRGHLEALRHIELFIRNQS